MRKVATTRAEPTALDLAAQEGPLAIWCVGFMDGEEGRRCERPEDETYRSGWKTGRREAGRDD